MAIPPRPSSFEPSTASFTVSAEEAGRRLDVFLAARLAPLSRTKAHALIQEGRVAALFPLKEMRPSLPVEEGQTFQVSIPAPVPSDIPPQALPLAIVYEDGDLLVVHKPAGLVVHPGAGNPDHTLLNALVAHCPTIEGVGGIQRPGLVHRLDKDKSGLLAVAKTDAAYRSLVGQLKSRRKRWEYLAMDRATLEGPWRVSAAIGRHAQARKRMAVRPESGKEAVTHFVPLQTLPEVSLLLLKLETGRTHQIRAHLNFIQHPVLGDSLYGGASALAGRPMLHAFRLSFLHPKTRKKIECQAEPPQDFLQCAKALGFKPFHWKKIKWSVPKP